MIYDLCITFPQSSILESELTAQHAIKRVMRGCCCAAFMDRVSSPLQTPYRMLTGLSSSLSTTRLEQQLIAAEAHVQHLQSIICSISSSCNTRPQLGGSDTTVGTNALLSVSGHCPQQLQTAGRERHHKEGQLASLCGPDWMRSC